MMATLRRLVIERPRPVWLTMAGAFVIVYTLTWGGHYTSGDGAQKIAWAKAMMYEGSADIDPGPDVRYTKYGVGHSLLAMVPLAASAAVERATGIRAEAALYTFMFVVNGAVFLALVAFYLSEFYGRREVIAQVAILGLATIWWPYTKIDYSEPLVLTGIFASFLLMRRGRVGTAMVLAGLTSTLRPDAMILAGLLGLWRLWITRSAVEAVVIALALVPGLAVHVAANLARYGSISGFGYGAERFDAPLLVGLYGLLFSAGKSVFLYTPPLVLGVLAFRKFAARPDQRKADAVFFLAVFVVQAVFYARYWAWSSDDSWGNRYLMAGALLMCLPAIELMHRRALTVAVAALGFSIQLLPVLMGGLDYLLMVRNHAGQKHLYYGYQGETNLGPDDFWYHPAYGQVPGTWTLLRVRLGLPPAPRDPSLSAAVGRSLYDAYPPEVWQQSARWDLFWLDLLQGRVHRNPDDAAR